MALDKTLNMKNVRLCFTLAWERIPIMGLGLNLCLRVWLADVLKDISSWKNRHLSLSTKTKICNKHHDKALFIVGMYHLTYIR